MEKKWQDFYNEARKGKFNILEYLSRSEGPQLFSTALNDILVRNANPEIADGWPAIFNEITINRRDISFPSIRGVNPDLVPELAEFKSIYPAFTSVTVTPQKFGMRIPFSREMAEDNEVDLLGWRTREVGRAHRELRRREAFKALSFFSTGPAVSTGIVGIRNHGISYAQGGYTNFFSGTALSWEGRIDRALTLLKNQTITVADMTIQFPVIADTIVANPHHQKDIQKVLNAGITVVSLGISTGSTPNVAGSNVFNGVLSNQIYDPTIPTGQAFILQSKRGLVMVNRTPLEMEMFEDQPFDVDDMKTRERFLPAVIEERFICDIQITG